MAKAILSRWPHLENEHMSYSDALNFFHRRLKTHFKNSRSANTENIPEILQKRATFGKRKASNNINENEVKKARMAWGVLNYLPNTEDGEDDVSQNKYIEILQKQNSIAQHKRDASQIKLALNKTFAYRRKMLVNELHSITSYAL